MWGGVIIYLFSYAAGICTALVTGPLPDTAFLITIATSLLTTILYFCQKHIRRGHNPLLTGLYYRYFTMAALFTLFELGMCRVEISPPQERVARRPNAAREIGAFIESQMGRKRESHILTAFITGDKSGLDRRTKSAFTGSGAAHIMALSGLHVGIVMALLRGVTSIFSFSLGARRARAFVIIAILSAMLAITGYVPSLARALVMAAIWQVSSLYGYRGERIEILAATAFLLLLYSPRSLGSPGFQLSFAAMAGIILIFPVLDENMKIALGSLHLPRPAAILAKSISATLLISISCQIATLPITWFHFGNLPDYYLITNLAAIPALTLCIWLFCAAALAGAIASPEISAPLWSLLEWLIRQLASLLEFLS